MSKIDNSLFQMQILLADAKKRNAPDVIVQAFEDSVEALGQTKWIPCTERLPGYGEEVLAFTKHGNIKVAFRDILTEPLWSTGFGKPLEIIAWMPLPEAYKAESEEEE